MITQNVSFRFKHSGATWEVDANFKRFSSTASADYDNEWAIDTIEVIGEDGMCCYAELTSLFTYKFASVELISLASLIEDKAREELE